MILSCLFPLSICELEVRTGFLDCLSAFNDYAVSQIGNLTKAALPGPFRRRRRHSVPVLHCDQKAAQGAPGFADRLIIFACTTQSDVRKPLHLEKSAPGDSLDAVG